LRTCPACGTLHADLLSIRAAIRHAWVPARPRDLSLTPADAARSRPSPWRRFLGVIGSSRDAVSRPLAASFTGLGIAGLLLTTIPLGAAGGAPTAAPIEAQTHTTGGDRPARGGDQHTMDVVEANPATCLSAGLLGVGGAVFGLRRLAGRARAVR
jgi:hypothetical protein